MDHAENARLAAEYGNLCLEILKDNAELKARALALKEMGVQLRAHLTIEAIVNLNPEMSSGTSKPVDDQIFLKGIGIDTDIKPE